MGSLVVETQIVFVQGRQIMDDALIACETVHWLKKSKKKGVLVKLDFKKAYDSVRWWFMDYVLDRIGFGEIWRR